MLQFKTEEFPNSPFAVHAVDPSTGAHATALRDGRVHIQGPFSLADLERTVARFRAEVPVRRPKIQRLAPV